MKRCNQLIFALITLAMSQTIHAAPEPLDRVTVQINEGIILESEVTGMVKTIQANAA
ncbi:peptidylprolyl isomerase SurA, partial [Shewanella sp. 0m-11]